MSKKSNTTMKNLLSRFEEETKIETTSIQNNVLQTEKLHEVIDFSIINDISDDMEIKEILKESTIRLFNIQTNSIIGLGMLFTDIYEKLSSKTNGAGVYEKWLIANNFSKSTAWRYRQRYIIFNSVADEKKHIVATLSQNIIKEIYALGLEKSIEFINNAKDKESIIEFFNPIKIETKTTDNIIIKEIDDYEKIFKILDENKSKIPELEENKKKELNKYLKRIEEILR